MAALSLEGIRVVDLTSHLSGPYCTMILGDHGADVIKIERPGLGDDARRMPPFVAGESAPFMLFNRNKRSVTLDLKDAGDLDLCRALIAQADVVVENFKPGAADRLGLGYDALAAVHPRLVYCSISGFGRTGPYRDRGGFDLMMQAMSGIMSVNGPEDGPPHRLPLPIADLGAGLFAAVGILAALRVRDQSGHGQRVDTSLFETAVALSVYEAAHVFTTGEPPPRLGQAHRGLAPYQVFRTADGWLTIGAGAQHLWLRFCEALGQPELATDARFRDNAARVANHPALVAAIERLLVARPTQEWVDRLSEVGVPVGPVQTYDQVFADPQVVDREMVAELPHAAAGATRTLGIPVKLSATPGTLRRAAPRLGEHTDEVLASLHQTHDRARPD